MQGVNTKINQGYALICPAQGFPVPVYKWVHSNSNKCTFYVRKYLFVHL